MIYVSFSCRLLRLHPAARWRCRWRRCCRCWTWLSVPLCFPLAVVLRSRLPGLLPGPLRRPQRPDGGTEPGQAEEGENLHTQEDNAVASDVPQYHVRTYNRDSFHVTKRDSLTFLR